METVHDLKDPQTAPYQFLFVRGYLEQYVHNKLPQTVDDLKKAIHAEISSTESDVLTKSL